MKPTVSVSRYDLLARDPVRRVLLPSTTPPVSVGCRPAASGWSGRACGTAGRPPPPRRTGERVQERRLAGVRVAHQRDRRKRRALALGALDRARSLHVLQAPAQRRDPVARQAAVGLDLRLPRSPRADPATEPLEVAPQPAHPREVVLELGQLDLQLALGAARVGGEDVEDHRRAIDDRQPDGLLEVALLAGGQLIVAGDQVRLARLRGGLRLLDLPRAEVGIRMRLLTALDHLAHDRHPGGSQQLAQLGEVVPLRQCRDAEGALARALGFLHLTGNSRSWARALPTARARAPPAAEPPRAGDRRGW